MTIERPDDQAHLRAWAAIPWIVNGSASAEQHDGVAQHLAHCADCQAELARQQSLAQAVLQAPLNLPDSPPDMQAGLAKLLARIDVDGVVDQPAQPVQPVDAPVPARWRTGRLSQALAAAVLVQAAALGVMGHYLSSHDAGAYRTLSAAPAPGASATLRVVPDSALTLATWNALLRAHRLQVVNGPNTVGAYGLAPLDGTASNPAAVVEALRRTPGVLLAQALSPGP